MTPPSFFGWYEILRTHHHWSKLQSLRYALWLSRSAGNPQVVRENRRLESRSESSGNGGLWRSLGDWFRLRRSAGERLQSTKPRLHPDK